jgi:malto-oligosyltrehalose synthase
MRAPTSTYRLQLHADFGFDAARDLVPYLADLGVDWLYLAPVFAAVPGSRHGYDVVDPLTVNPELGGRAGLEALADAVHAAGMYVLLDIVPNHQAATTRNTRWFALLRDGPGVERAFDVDPAGNAQVEPGRVLWPLLGAPVAEALASGALHAARAADGTVELRYDDERLPLHGVVDPDDADAVTAALDRQHYRLADWRTGTPYLNYRRFFDVSTLAAVRVEDPEVFAETHALVAELCDRGIVDGLRVDHVDGLADPEAYLRRLAGLVPGTLVVVEKILTGDETLRDTWPIAGTTGYESLADLTALLLDPDGRSRLERALLAEPDQPAFRAMERAAKEHVRRALLQPEWRRVEQALEAAATAAGIAVAPEQLCAALGEVTTALAVYRTYATGDETTGADRSWIDAAVDRARACTDGAALDALAGLLHGEEVPEAARPARRVFVQVWQQVTDPVMAKGHEDTASYRYPVVLAQAEVGDDPGASARDAVPRFHARAARRVASGRAGLTATTTHDTKRSEDVRARLAVLTERADAFEAGYARWKAALAPAPAIRARELRFVAQTVLGTWPLDPDELDDLSARLAEYFVKALREAKESTSWLQPDEAHEAEVVALAARSLADGGRVMHETFGDLLEDVAWYGAINALAQLTWKLALPGAADVYRGCELWDFSLVDPDNRRPVDYATRVALLQERSDDWRSGAVKLHCTATGLRARRAEPDLFATGRHVPLAVAGDAAVAFARAGTDRWALACAPRLATRLAPRGRWPVGAEVWGDRALALPPGAPTAWRNVYTDEPVAAVDGALPIRDVLTRLPVALLLSD